MLRWEAIEALSWVGLIGWWLNCLRSMGDEVPILRWKHMAYCMTV
jgi:hypothetical protein